MSPDEERWVRERIDRLVDDEQVTNRHLISLNNRLKAIERQRNWVIGSVAALAVSVLTGLAGVIWWASSISTRVEMEAETRAAVKELAKEFHEHERRTSPPKPEAVK